MKRKRAFTLIELLVVISIVLIIASILLPVFEQAREKAQQTVCVSNLRQLGMAVQMYAGDYNERLPGVGPGWGGVGILGGWMYIVKFDISGEGSLFDPTRGSIYPYVKSKDVYICPADALAHTTGDSYSYNSCLTVPSFVTPQSIDVIWPGKLLSAFSQPSDTLAIAEKAAPNSGPYQSANDGLFSYLGVPVGAPGEDWDHYSLRHSGGSNVVLLDGHAKWMSFGNLVTSNLPSGGGFPYCDQ